MTSGKNLGRISRSAMRRRSPASTPLTASLNVTVTCVRFVTVALAAGTLAEIVGATRSSKLELQVEPGAVESNGSGKRSTSCS